MARNEKIWKKLTRLFRSGPVIRHKITSGLAHVEPTGTAAAYKKELSSLYVSSMASYGQYERLARYADYSEMEFTPEIASALDIYADEVTSVNEKGHMLTIESENSEIKAILETLFFDILNVEFNLHSWTRNLCKYGDFILFVDASEENGILNLLPIPINEIEREEGYDPKDPFAVRFRWLTQGNKILENWQVIHFRLLGNDNFLPYGSSVIEPARRVWRQLILIEDAMLVYRIVRSPERRVFKIEVGNVKPEDIPTEMDRVISKLKRSQIADATTGRVDLRYNPLSVDEDYFLPMRNGVGSSIDSLPGGQFTGDIDDVNYIQSKMFAALKIPKSYLSFEGDIGSKATLAQQDVRFSRTTQRIQKIVLSELTKIAVIHLYILGFRGADLMDYEIKMANPSTIAEQQKLELWRMKFEIASAAAEGVLDRATVQEDIFGFDSKKIDKILGGKRFDKLEDLTLENMKLPEDEAPTGTEDLPSSLSGAPDDEEGGDTDSGEDIPTPDLPGAPEEVPEEDVDQGGPALLEDDPEPLEPEIEEVRNPGSEGDDAVFAVDQGKDLFSTGEDQYTAVFGTEKQAASDPYDTRFFGRMLRRPFSEELGRWVEDKMESAQIIENKMDDIKKSLTGISRRSVRKGPRRI